MVTVRQSGGDYTTLKAAIDADETTIAIDETWTVDDTYTTETITVDSGFAPTITCSGGAENIGRPHDGSETTYRLRKTGAGHLFTLNDDITIVGMDMQNGSTGNSDEVMRENGGIALTCTDCVMGFDTRNGSQTITFRTSSTGSVMVLTNCYLYSGMLSAIYFTGGDVASTTELNCCHFFDNGDRTDTGGSVRVRGQNQTIRTFNSAFNSGPSSAQPFSEHSSAAPVLHVDRCITDQSDWTIGGGWTETIGDVLLSRTWTANASPGAGDFVIVEDISTSPFDMRLQDNATDNDAQDNHADSSGAGLTMPSTDIIGTSRPQNTNYDVGMFEIVAAAGGDVFFENLVSAIEQQQKPLTAHGLGGVLIQ